MYERHQNRPSERGTEVLQGHQEHKEQTCHSDGQADTPQSLQYCTTALAQGQLQSWGKVSELSTEAILAHGLMLNILLC